MMRHFRFYVLKGDQIQFCGPSRFATNTKRNINWHFVPVELPIDSIIALVHDSDQITRRLTPILAFNCKLPDKRSGFEFIHEIGVPARFRIYPTIKLVTPPLQEREKVFVNGKLVN